MSKRAIHIITVLLLILTNVGCDQVTKQMARSKIEFREHIDVWGDYVYLTRVENTGAFLSLGADMPPVVNIIVLSVLPCLLLLFGIYMLLKRMNLPRFQLWGWCFIIGGGIGNIYDRILYSSVTDFMNIGIGDLRTGIFNMADVSIMIGLGLVVWNMLTTRKKEPAETAA